ncbi:MAG: hypothetical protein UT42_C0002G0003 [Candidatus Falkowbacteria bacterium GW2011_GWA2_39_24]|uniref:Nucleotidyl transferase AbiEii/AbiGii toxin family protein n=1 Tax=Candidatus Falkowbacteria bacterium GW2011_GWA2_39_24 TaxID=1618634 RepID=A0A0G0RP91_9BACT|nr:MAG: hypothetical protein UT42_C0002G0003 [Candidatus Falkowbacteria bacterium GW2011_GWA2_39_24]
MKKTIFHYDILDKQRRSVLPLLKQFKSKFYLAGGTGLALQLGHRDSIDFDFFSPKPIDTVKLYVEVKETFVGYKIKKIQEEKNTLTVVLNQKIKISFFTYPYKLISPVVVDEYLRLASVSDIAAMKFSTIISRATNKDYIDIYYILQNGYDLSQLLQFAEKKFKDLERNLILKSLVYFVDVTKEPIRFITTPVAWQQVQTDLKKAVQQLKI